MKLEDLEKLNLTMVHTMSFKPDYLQAIGSVSVEINSLEMMLAFILRGILKISKETAEAIYFAPNGMSVRIAILEGALLELEPALKKEIGSLLGRVKGAMTRRNEMVHDHWMLDKETQTVTRRGSRKHLGPKVVPLGEVKQLCRDLRSIGLEAAVIGARIAVPSRSRHGQTIQEP